MNETASRGRRTAGSQQSKNSKVSSYAYTSVLTCRPMELKLPTQFGMCRPVYDFERLNQIGEGTYGVVFRAWDESFKRVVALKRLRTGIHDEGVSLSSLREVKILFKVNHRNIIRLLGVAVSRELSTFYLVMEYCEHDLANLLDNMSVPFTESQTKCLIMQTLQGLAFLHQAFIVHRDLKMSNLLLCDDGCLKIADFGLARNFSYPTLEATPNVMTLWYRAPEVLLESRCLCKSMDIWSAGCILAELLLHRPFLPGQSQIHQIQLVFSTFGTPNETIWPRVSELPAWRNFHFDRQPYNKLNTIFPSLSSSGLELLQSMFVYDPQKRATAEQCLQSPYFLEPPHPISQSLMPTFPQHRNLK